LLITACCFPLLIVVLQLPQLPAGLRTLRCEGCHSLRQLPPLAHTEAEVLEISDCPFLAEIPDLPQNHLRYLFAVHLPRVTRLPTLRKDKHYGAVYVIGSGIDELPNLLPHILR
jgi:hypothetical protein